MNTLAQGGLLLILFYLCWVEGRSPSIDTTLPTTQGWWLGSYNEQRDLVIDFVTNLKLSNNHLSRKSDRSIF